MRHHIGITLESLQLPLKQAVDAAATLGVAGVQFQAVGDLAPDQLGETGRKDLRHRLGSRGLTIAALGCPLRHGLNVQENLEARISHVKKVMTLAYDLGPRLVVLYPGILPAEPEAPERLLLTQGLSELGCYGERVGSTLALEMGQEAPADWAAYLQGFTSGGLGVTIDPANLVGLRYEPAEAVPTLHAFVRYVYARDGVAGRAGSGVTETPLGHGDVDWMACLGALTEVGYAGWLTIQRGLTRDPLGEARAAVTFLRRLVG